MYFYSFEYLCNPKGNGAYTFLKMHKEKENAQLSEMIERAQKKGINLIPLIDLFTSWYEPKDVFQLLDRMEHTYTLSFLADEDNLCHFDEMKDHLIFIRSVKQIMIA